MKYYESKLYILNRVNPLNQSKYIIKIEERIIKMISPFQTTKEMIMKYKNNYSYLYMSLVQIGIKPISMEEMNTTILTCVRDARFNNFKDSLLGTIESSLSNGPIYFNCYPNYIVCLED